MAASSRGRLRHKIEKDSQEYELMKKFSSKLNVAMIHPIEISNRLQSLNVIDAKTHEKVTQRAEKGVDCSASNFLMDAVQRYIKVHPKGKPLRDEFLKILEVFDKYVPLNKVSNKMRKEYERQVIADSSSSSGNEDKASRDVMSEETPSRHGELIAALKFYRRDLDISGVNFEPVITLIKSRIENHIKTSLEDGIAYDEVSKQIHDFMTNALIPADIFGWCLEMLKDCKKVTECSEEAAVGPKTPPDDVPPLFCKDVVYHASICCNAICNLSKDQTLSLQTMFSGQGHTFKHVSLSSDRLLLIAQKDDVMYFCFGSNYVAGILNNFVQRKDIDYKKVLPQRYLTELLRQGKRLVFTGFSFSSMIACSIITNLWDSPLNTAKTLFDNATCILFGPVAEHYNLQKAPVQPLFLKTIHAFYIKDDVVPKLSNTSIFESIVHMNNSFISYPEGIEHVKLWLRKGTYGEDSLFHHDDDILYGCCSYLISQDNQSLYWKKLDDIGRASELYRITKDYINKLSDYNLSQHQMENYLILVQRGYLEKEVPYSFPEKANAISGIHALKPKLERVEVHCQEHPDGRELTLMFIGDNMWFSQEFQVSFDDSKQPLRICIDSENVSQKQIQYCHGEIADAITDKSVTHCQVKVTSTFQIFTANVLLLFKNPDPISFRQSQLAKQNPSEIIKLSFLSALLELSPYSQGASRPSERFMLIIGFLQQAARIVPLESILFAIASCSSDETMIKFVVACAQHFIEVPCSKVMQIGYKKAYNRIRTGKITPSSQYDLVEEVSHLHWQDMYPHEYLAATDIRVHQQYRNQYNDLSAASQVHYQQQYQYNGLAASQVQQQYQYNDLAATQVQQQYQYSDLAASHQYQIAALEQARQPFFRPHPQKPPQRMGKSNRISQSMLINIFLRVATNSQARCERPRKLICGQNIGEIYPVDFSLHPEPCETPLKSLPQILHDARKKLSNLSFAHNNMKGGDILSPNGEMLQLVNGIIENDLEPCVSMLGGFMEQQIRIPLVNNPKDTAEAFVSAETSGAVGVWALFALGRSDIESILCGSQGSQTFVVQIAQFIQGVLNEAVKPRHSIPHPVSSYDGKLQFLLQGLTNTVSCSSHYISYTLERELVQLCSNFKITPKSKVDELTSNWDMKFKETALALVPNSHRPIVARWIIWALNIHQLREGLAKYISIGVIGLVNSGKSTLVKKLFKKEAVSGTFQSARTTIPFIYNMDDSVEGLGVIDFPGVDDRDESIKGLAKLLVGLAQIVVFVCSYEKFHTISAKEWTSVFHNELSSTPILVCLTHADRLCEESEDYMKLFTADECKETMRIQDMTRRFDLELKEIVNDDLPNNCTAKFCTLTQHRSSVLKEEKSQKIIRKTGIFTPKDIGDWIIDAIETHLKQSDLAHRLSSFFNKQD